LKKQRPVAENVQPADARIHIGIPINCKYVGGNADLGERGHGFWIEGGRFGHGEFHLSHSIPLTDVTAVTIAQRGTAEPASNGPLLAAGGGVYGLGGVGGRAAKPKITTDLIVRTSDGQEARWIVEQRGGDWVQAKLADLLRDLGIPLG
jgi:hypothetical protein